MKKTLLLLFAVLLCSSIALAVPDLRGGEIDVVNDNHIVYHKTVMNATGFWNVILDFFGFSQDEEVVINVVANNVSNFYNSLEDFYYDKGVIRIYPSFEVTNLTFEVPYNMTTSVIGFPGLKHCNDSDFNGTDCVSGWGPYDLSNLTQYVVPPYFMYEMKELHSTYYVGAGQTYANITSCLKAINGTTDNGCALVDASVTYTIDDAYNFTFNQSTIGMWAIYFAGDYQTLDCNGTTFNGNNYSEGYGFYNSMYAPPTIKNCNIVDFGDGIGHITGSGFMYLINNTISLCENGIFAESGIDLTNSTFYSNENDVHIYGVWSHCNRIVNNNFNGVNGLVFEGYTVGNCYNGNIAYNVFNSINIGVWLIPLLYNPGSGISPYSPTWLDINHNNFTKNMYGVKIENLGASSWYNAWNDTIRDNNFIDNSFGVYVFNSSRNGNHYGNPVTAYPKYIIKNNNFNNASVVSEYTHAVYVDNNSFFRSGIHIANSRAVGTRFGTYIENNNMQACINLYSPSFNWTCINAFLLNNVSIMGNDVNSAILTINSSDEVVMNNYIDGSLLGILYSGSSLVQNNTIKNNWDNGPRFYLISSQNQNVYLNNFLNGGIELNTVSDSNIESNLFDNNSISIYSQYSFGNSISKNKFTNGINYSVMLDSGSINNTLSENILNDTVGFYITSSGNNISKNIFRSSNTSLIMAGIHNSVYLNNFLVTGVDERTIGLEFVASYSPMHYGGMNFDNVIFVNPFTSAFVPVTADGDLVPLSVGTDDFDLILFNDSGIIFGTPGKFYTAYVMNSTEVGLTDCASFSNVTGNPVNQCYYYKQKAYTANGVSQNYSWIDSFNSTYYVQAGRTSPPYLSYFNSSVVQNDYCINSKGNFYEEDLDVMPGDCGPANISTGTIVAPPARVDWKQQDSSMLPVWYDVIFNGVLSQNTTDRNYSFAGTRGVTYSVRLVPFVHGSRYNATNVFGNFTINSLPIVNLVSPVDLATINSDYGNIGFAWNYTDVDNQSQSRYNFMLDNDFDFSSPIINHTASSSSKTYSASLTAGGDYYWKVKAYDGLEWGNFSTPFRVKVIITEKPIKNLLGESGAGIAIFLNYLGYGLFYLLIVLILVCIVSMIGWSIFRRN